MKRMAFLSEIFGRSGQQKVCEIYNNGKNGKRDKQILTSMKYNNQGREHTTHSVANGTNNKDL